MGNAAHSLRHSAKGHQTQFLAAQFCARRAVEAMADGIDEHTDDQFGHSVGILSGRIHYANAVRSRSLQVNIVVARASANNHAEFGCGIHHFAVNLVRADNQCVHIGHGFEQLCALRIFFQQRKVVARCLSNFPDTFHRNRCKGFLGGN